MSQPPTKHKKDHQMLVRYEDDVHEWLREKAGERRVSIAQVIRDALYAAMIEDQRRDGK